MRILVLADNSKDAQWIAQLLEPDTIDPFELTSAATLDEGQARLDHGEFDAIVLYRAGWDQVSQSLTALKDQHAIKGRAAGAIPLPVIVISENGGGSDHALALEAGALDYLSRLQANNGILSAALHKAQEIHRLQKALRESEAQYRLLADSIADVIGLHRPDGSPTYVSPSAEKLFGQPVEQILAGNWFDLVHPEDRERVRTTVEEHKSRLENCTFQARYLLPTGESTWVETNVSLILTETDQITQLMTISREITIRKQAEEILRQAKLERDQLMSSITDAIWSADVTATGRWSYRYLSPVIEKITGYSTEEFIHQPRLAIEMILEEDRPAAMQKFVRMNRALEPRLEIEYRIVRRDGPIRWVRDSQMARHLDEMTVRLDGVLSDVTDRKEAEEGLQRAHEELRYITESVSDSLWSAELDSAGDLTARYISPVIEKITGQAPDYFLREFKDRWFSILYPEDRPLVESVLNSVIQGSSEYEIEYRVVHANGAIRWVRDSVRARRTRSGHSLLNGVVTDITERKLADQALQEANEQLRVSVVEMETRNQQISLINEMGDLMQSCLKASDVFEVMSTFGERLFPGHSGALYMLDERKRLVESNSVWGGDLHSELLFAPEDCWALRRGRVHSVNDPRSELDCAHIHISSSTPYSCIPMTAHGDTLGSFYLECSGDHVHIRCRETAILVAERVALALANLRLHESLQNQSIRDSLTGLFNRRYMVDTVERELRQAARKHHGVGIIMIDIDAFKTFNDSYGHGAGDVLLQSLGDFLQVNVRGGDIVCRYGGDEFVLIFPDATLLNTTERAQQLQEGIRRMRVHYHGEGLGTLSVSMGVSAYPEHGEGLEPLLRVADRALYRAKELGKDRIEVA